MIEGKRDVIITDNENNIFTFNDNKLNGDIKLFIYNDKNLKEINGQNAFPDNFHELIELLNEVRENGLN